MKGSIAIAALAVVSSALAMPSVTKPLAPRQSSSTIVKATVPITVKGNGMPSASTSKVKC